MRRLSHLLLLLAVTGLAVLLAGCVTRAPGPLQPPSVAAPRQALPVQPSPTQPFLTQTGLASFYGGSQNGKTTASGEQFDQQEFTAAHRTLAFGTMVRVTNLENGRTVQVRITDRGPHIKGRIIDLSAAAAEALDMRQDGITRVKLEAFR